MKLLSWALFAVGTLIAISGGAKMPAAGAKWPDTVPLFIAGAVLAAAGVALWRYALRVENRAARMNAGEHAEGDALSLLGAVIAPTRALLDEVDQLEGHAVTERVDHLQETYILPFAERRQEIVNRFGMSRGAEILVTVAFGERMLNRVWSAAADGHMPEARAVLPDALSALEEARDMSERALATERG